MLTCKPCSPPRIRPPPMLARKITSSIRCCSPPNEKARKKTKAALAPFRLVFNNSGDVYVSIGERGKTVEWDAVPISPEAKSLLRNHEVKPSTALKMHRALGFEGVDDVRRLTPDLVAQLKLKPLQLEPLLHMLQAHETEQLRFPAVEEDDGLNLEESAAAVQQQELGLGPEKPPLPAAAAAPQTQPQPQRRIASLVPAERSGLRYLAITADGRRALASTSSHALQLWDLATDSVITTMQGHENHTWCGAVTADGRTAVTGSVDGTLRVWDLGTGECTALLEGHGESSIGALALTPDGRQAVSAGCCVLRVWDLAAGACVSVLRGHQDWVRGVAVTPDGRRAVSGSGHAAGLGPGHARLHRHPGGALGLCVGRGHHPRRPPRGLRRSRL